MSLGAGSEAESKYIEGEKKYLYVLPIGNIDQEILQYILKIIEKKFNLPAKLGTAIKIPDNAFNPVRGQYDASIMLNGVRAVSPSNTKKVLAVTEEDIFSNNLNFIFGQAILGGCCGIISLSRLRAGTDKTNGKQLFLQRVEKEAVHELGHTFGLRHCSNPRCVMYFSNSLADTDRKSADFCQECGFPIY
ncbi:MAG: archaemetzincin family Zn-dependent metalloprotease [Actinomycetota bacterium]|nr:archaemetzincin family Zn-dependent metalloprotease [Actinomycetota bacterium]